MRSTEVGGFGPAPRRWPLLVGAVAAVLMLALAVVGAIALLSGGKKTGQAAVKPPAAVTTTAAPAVTPSTTVSTQVAVSPTATPPDQVLVLPAPAGNDDGVPVGYPQTLAGAVSAAEHFEVAIGSTLNPDRAAVIGRVVAAPSFTNAPTTFAANVAGSRKLLGLPPLATTTDPDTLILTPMAYQVRDVNPTSITVLLLSKALVTKATETQSGNLATLSSMVWVGGDWRIANNNQLSDADRLRLSVDPSNAPLALSLGWMFFNA